MASQPDDYQYVYNVGLLDDLHNYFPAFLYDSGRFQTPVQVFHYFRSQFNARFNLPSHGARLAGFAQTHIPTMQERSIPIQPQQPPPQARSRNDRSALNAAAVLVGLLEGSGGILAENSYFYSQPNPFIEPVTVRPSDEVIATNTTVQPGSDCPDGSACAICQDSIEGNDVCRLLNTCHHVYHKTCIDQWFLTNVHCPTCRQDIRESVAAPRAQET